MVKALVSYEKLPEVIRDSKVFLFRASIARGDIEPSSTCTTGGATVACGFEASETFLGAVAPDFSLCWRDGVLVFLAPSVDLSEEDRRTPVSVDVLSELSRLVVAVVEDIRYKMVNVDLITKERAKNRV